MILINRLGHKGITALPAAYAIVCCALGKRALQGCCRSPAQTDRRRWKSLSEREHFPPSGPSEEGC